VLGRLQKYSSRLLLTLSILLPVVAGILFLLSITERDNAVRLKEPHKYPWEFKITNRESFPEVLRWPVFPVDSVENQIIIRICPELNDVSSILFIDPKNDAPTPTYNNYITPNLQFGSFSLTHDANGKPEIALARSVPGQLDSGILYFRLFQNADLDGMELFSEAGILKGSNQKPFSDRGAERNFYADFPDSGYTDLKSNVWAMADIDPKLPGMEILFKTGGGITTTPN
jgi:hypothetical protein